jgi:hydroxymethylbilane synthase
MSERPRIGTRGSRLALAQVEILCNLGLVFEPVVIRTQGDDGDVRQVGAFVNDIQQALLRGEIDAAIHCLKDVPTEPVPGLAVSAILEREDPRDAWITLPGVSPRLSRKVGTGSLRRTSQLRRIAPRADFVEITGNVDSRIQRVVAGELDAVVLAMAGLKRLQVDAGEWGIQISPLAVETVIPAAGQGALVLETRADQTGLYAELNHLPTEIATQAERAFLHRFGVGCNLPVGALALVYGERLALTGGVFSEDGKEAIRDILEGPAADPEGLANRLADRLCDRGALALIPKTPEGIYA